jgi:hypothetical protein
VKSLEKFFNDESFPVSMNNIKAFHGLNHQRLERLHQNLIKQVIDFSQQFTLQKPIKRKLKSENLSFINFPSHAYRIEHCL